MMEERTKEELTQEIKELRWLLWLWHGTEHFGKISGDGENTMVCDYCHIDFKEDSIEYIMNHINRGSGGVLEEKPV